MPGEISQVARTLQAELKSLRSSRMAQQRHIACGRLGVFAWWASFGVRRRWCCAVPVAADSISVDIYFAAERAPAGPAFFLRNHPLRPPFGTGHPKYSPEYSTNTCTDIYAKIYRTRRTGDDGDGKICVIVRMSVAHNSRRENARSGNIFCVLGVRACVRRRQSTVTNVSVYICM